MATVAAPTKRAFYEATTHNQFGFHLPGISDDARHALAECLEDNHKRNHILFDDKKGFHNHLTHHLLAAFALGASADRIRAIHKHQSHKQLPIKSTHEDENRSFDLEAHWGDDNYYQDYLRFFTREVEEKDGGDGRRTVERWMFEDVPEAKRCQFFGRCLSGAYHPLIHLGYGLEFGLNVMIAEGLAEAATHSPMVAPLVLPEVNETGLKSAKELAFAVLEDKRLDGHVQFEDIAKLKTLLNRGGGPIISEHAAQWSCPLNQLQQKANELQQLAVAVFAGAVRPEKKVIMDFFLMHAVTSSVFLPVFVSSFRPSNAARLLRNKLAIDLGYFASRGRPQLNLDQLLTYERRHNALKGHENPWFGIWDAVLDHTQYPDEHVVKAIRALSYADLQHRDCGLLRQESYLGAACMVIDNVKSVADWTHEGVGFEQMWKDVPDRD